MAYAGDPWNGARFDAVFPGNGRHWKPSIARSG